jgi:hypothetical protein
MKYKLPQEEQQQPVSKKARTRDDVAGHQDCKQAQNALSAPVDQALAQEDKQTKREEKENKG